jgi:Holliday junction resolvase RusA-like endonuclease
VRGIPDRRPRYSPWIKGQPCSVQASGPSTRYVASVQEQARKQVQGPPLSSKRIDVEIISGARGARPEVDNVSKLLLDAMKGIVYNDDSQVRAVKIVALRLDEEFHARGTDKVFMRLLWREEFLVNVFEGGEVDVYLVDSDTPADEKLSVVMLTAGRYEPVSEPPAATEGPEPSCARARALLHWALGADGTHTEGPEARVLSPAIIEIAPSTVELGFTACLTERARGGGRHDQANRLAYAPTPDAANLDRQRTVAR